MLALIGAEDSSSYQLVRAIGAGEFRLALSDEFLRELSELVAYPKVETRIVSLSRAFHMALDVGVMGEMRYPRRLDWPSVPDQRDWWMLDLAWNSEADYIVSWDPHLTNADLPLPLEVVTPPALLRAPDL